MPVSTGNGFCKVTALLPDAVVSAEPTAPTVTVLELGTVVGAMNAPDELIIPVAALPPVTPFTCQVTEVFDDPATVALKDCVAPARTFTFAGETATVTLDPEDGVLELEAEELFVVPAQPASAAAAGRNTKSSECRKTNFFNLVIRMRTESAALRRRIACTELCPGAGRGTTVRKDKIRYGTPEQDCHFVFWIGITVRQTQGRISPVVIQFRRMRRCNTKYQSILILTYGSCIDKMLAG
jgi:hypothetical protein